MPVCLVHTSPKRLKASKVLGTDSWQRKSAEALLKPGGLCHFTPGEGVDLRGALSAEIALQF